MRVLQERFTASAALPLIAVSAEAVLSLCDSAKAQASESPIAEQSYTPAVSPRTSVKPDHIVSLIDGKHYEMLRRQWPKANIGLPNGRLLCTS